MKILDSIASSGKINSSDIGIPSPAINADLAIAGILNTVYQVAGLLAVVIIIVAGYIYTTSDGNASRIKLARDAIMGAVIGLVVIMLAFGITQFVIGRF